MKTQIIHEDQHILVCHKPAGIAVQSANIAQQDMVSELKNYLKKDKKDPYLGIVHRLDQPVSGIVVFAKNSKSAASLSAQIQDGRAKKIYRALVWGSFNEEEKSGTLEHLLYKDGKTNLSRAVEATAPEVKAAKKAKLNYRIIKEIEIDGEVCTEVEIELFTGRHHQIRVQAWIFFLKLYVRKLRKVFCQGIFYLFRNDSINRQELPNICKKCWLHLSGSIPLFP